MKRRSFFLIIFAVGCFIGTSTLIPSLAPAEADKIKTAMAALKAKTEKLGAPKMEGKWSMRLQKSTAERQRSL